MARTVIPVVRATSRDAVQLGGTLAAPAGAGIALDQGNGMVVTPKRASKLLVVIYNSKAGNIVTTVRAGIYPPGEDQTLGDLVLAGQVTVTFSFLLGFSGRFCQAGGAINLDWDAGATGVVWAYEMPA
jgi:hypothetical protein